MTTTMPSGSEVESAVFHPPEQSGIRSRLGDLKTRGVQRASRMQSNLQTSMRTSPMKWAGIAAGAGLGLGLIGRLIQTRRNRAMPDLVIIESSC